MSLQRMFLRKVLHVSVKAKNVIPSVSSHELTDLRDFANVREHTGETRVRKLPTFDAYKINLAHCEPP